MDFVASVDTTATTATQSQLTRQHG